MNKFNINTVSDLLGLPKDQSLHDFANVVIDGPDNQVFIDPIQILYNQDSFSKQAQKAIKSFFAHVTNVLTTKPLNEVKLKSLFKYSSENNSTRLGTSRLIPNSYAKGNGCTPDMLYKLFTQDTVIQLAEKGVFTQTPANVSLYVKGFDKDRMTDLISSLIFHLLVEFTDEQMQKGKKKVLQSPIPLKYMYWNHLKNAWEENEYYPYLDFNKQPIVLLPKNILTGYYVYNAQSFIRGHVLLTIQKNMLKAAKAKDSTAKKQKLDDLQEILRNELGLKSTVWKDMLIEYTLKQPNLDMLQDFKNQDKYSNMFSYSGKLTDDQLTRIIMKPYTSHRMVD